jgi:hypothetical protein
MSEAERLATLRDPKVPADQKRALLAVLPESMDLSNTVDAVTPPELKSELCALFGKRVRQLGVWATLDDSYGDAVKGDLMVDGRQFAALPFRGKVPFCATRFAAKDVEGKTLEWTASEPLSATDTNKLFFRQEGRGVHWVLNATAEYGWFLNTPLRLELSNNVRDQVAAVGARIEYWGKAFHMSIAPKASTLYREALTGSALSNWAPAADFYVGYCLASTSHTFRVWGALDVGLWNIVAPSARLSVAVSLFDRLFVTLNYDVHLVPFLGDKYSVTSAASWSLDKQMMMSVGIAVGFGF